MVETWLVLPHKLWVITLIESHEIMKIAVGQSLPEKAQLLTSPTTVPLKLGQNLSQSSSTDGVYKIIASTSV